ncbi:MAG: hypothetical protein IT453_22575 [Planctomycetes bacterium]|nr:hypothetical protein [Planctomycetota bacterium]
MHLHLVPLKEIDDLNFAKADPNPDPQALDAAAEKIRTALRALGRREVAS